MAKILIAEDNDVQRTVLKQILEGAGHSVVAAPNGAVAGKLFRQDPADLVVTDIFMPEEDGIGFIRGLVKDYPNVKIIALSAGSPEIDMDFLSVAEKLGAARSFVKPVNRQVLLDTIEELLSGTG